MSGGTAGARLRAVAVIPVRYGATRLPGKPLLAQTGKPLVRHVWEQVRRAASLDAVLIATDDERIEAACRAFGAQVERTSAAHPSGSDRVAEVMGRRDEPLVLNVQGDEPEIDPGDLDRLVARLRDGDEELVTLVRPFDADEQRDWLSPHVVKAVVDARGRALYFSRSPVPHGDSPLGACAHQGVYGWRRPALLRFAAAPPGALERRERLEQLRALELGLRIGVVTTAHRSLGIDTPEDYARFVARTEAARSAS